jgi:hypothetical protein
MPARQDLRAKRSNGVDVWLPAVADTIGGNIPHLVIGIGGGSVPL